MEEICNVVMVMTNIAACLTTGCLAGNFAWALQARSERNELDFRRLQQLELQTSHASSEGNAIRWDTRRCSPSIWYLRSERSTPSISEAMQSNYATSPIMMQVG